MAVGQPRVCEALSTFSLAGYLQVDAELKNSLSGGNQGETSFAS